MRRRAFLATGIVGMTAGCSSLGILESNRELGVAEQFGELEVTATEAMTASSIGIDVPFGDRMQKAPPNGKFALFAIKVQNNDIQPLEGPGVNIHHYTNMEKGDREFFGGAANDIRVYGSGEGGNLPPINAAAVAYENLSVNGVSLNTYPADQTGSGPQIQPSKSFTGWVFAIIEADATPQVKVQFRGKSKMWTAEGEPLDTPTDDGSDLPPI